MALHNETILRERTITSTRHRSKNSLGQMKRRILRALWKQATWVIWATLWPFMSTEIDTQQLLKCDFPSPEYEFACFSRIFSSRGNQDFEFGGLCSQYWTILGNLEKYVMKLTYFVYHRILQHECGINNKVKNRFIKCLGNNSYLIKWVFPGWKLQLSLQNR